MCGDHSPSSHGTVTAVYPPESGPPASGPSPSVPFGSGPFLPGSAPAQADPYQAAADLGVELPLHYHFYQPVTYTERPPKRWVVAATGAVLGGLTLLVGLFDPRTHQLGTCPLLLLTGWYCPACGATRATHLMVRGSFVEALHYNALWVVLFPLCLYGLVSWALHAAFRRRVIPRVRIDTWLPNAVLIAMVVFGVVRNLPLDFLSVLNPPL